MTLVHGTMDRSAGMLRLSRRLDERFRVVRYDRRGYGRSIDVGPPWTLAANADDLEALLDTAGGPSWVFGHSLGGNVVLAVAARRPDLVCGVVVYEPPLSWMPWWPADTVGAAVMAQPDPADAAETFMRRMVGDTLWERLPASTRESRRAEGPAMVAELADLRRHEPWDAADIGIPVLAMCGARGREHHRAGTVALTDVLADCRVATVADAGHGGPHTHAASVAAAITEFVDAFGDRAR
jgi:pimeloyl-ACP methyl ester carboxylesterase